MGVRRDGGFVGVAADTRSAERGARALDARRNRPPASERRDRIAATCRPQQKVSAHPELAGKYRPSIHGRIYTE
ncbi:hypothetical protein GCM10023205_18000 [Yinghuangia aomiensis]|uniref:Uncharacterized protein n=1 Tax=Yinghuangia aomiensis TaxID=676205 RepID=A0ABP9GXN4_9ACTN